MGLGRDSWVSEKEKRIPNLDEMKLKHVGIWGRILLRKKVDG